MAYDLEHNRQRNNFWTRIALIGSIIVTPPLCYAAYSGFIFLQEGARLASCRPYSVNWVNHWYAEDHDGIYPPLSSTPGRLFFAEGTELPYISLGVRCDFLCESDLQHRQPVAEMPDTPLDDWSYVYLGYVIQNQAQLEHFAEAYRRILAEGGDFAQDIKVASGEGNCGTDTIYRLRQLDQLFELLPCLRDNLDTVPVAIEWPENHRGPVAKVLTLDPDSRGEKHHFPGDWPMTTEAIGVLRDLDGLGE